MRLRAFCFVGLVAVELLGCAPLASSEPTHATADAATIAAIHARRCGSCHVAPAPKSRTREQVDAAVERHQKRVRLTPAQWAAMSDYLTGPDGSTAR